MPKKRNVVKQYDKKHGVLTIYRNDTVTENNGGMTTWTHKKFLKTLDKNIVRSMLEAVYGVNCIREAEETVTKLVAKESKHDKAEAEAEAEIPLTIEEGILEIRQGAPSYTKSRCSCGNPDCPDGDAS
jgi:hypothetical protein